MLNIKIVFLIISIFLSSSLYSQDYRFLVKGGVNYSTADRIDSESHSYGYKFGEVLFLSFEGDIWNDFSWSFDFGLNSKGYEGSDSSDYYSVELPVMINYSFNSLSLYAGLYTSMVFVKGYNLGIIGNHGEMNTDRGFLLGIEYNYKKFRFNIRFQKGYGQLKASNPEEDTPYVTNNRQFTFMIGYEVF